MVSKKDDTMSSMSNTRKDIAERLGSAQPNDRPGKKAKFGRIDSMLDYAKKLDSQLDSIRSDVFLLQTRRLGRVIGGLIRAQKSNDESQLDAFSNELNSVRSEANKVCNEKFSRPGVKTKFEYSQSDYMALLRYYKMAMDGNPNAFEGNTAERLAKKAIASPNYRPNPNASSSHDLAKELLEGLEDA